MKAGYIAGVCSAKNDPIVRQHGATEVVDYNKVSENLMNLVNHTSFDCSMTYPHSSLETVRETVRLREISLTWFTTPVQPVAQGRTTRTR